MALPTKLVSRIKPIIFVSLIQPSILWVYQFINGNYPKKIFSSGSLGVMGAGLPYAIGLQIANPEKLVIDIDGDASF